MRNHILLTSFLCSLFVISCNKTSKSETETSVGNYKTPVSIPLIFTDPEPFEWETITSDTLTTPVSYSLNVDALPSKPFELNEFKPLKTPIKEYDLDWGNFPTEKLKFDPVPFTVTKSTIKKPIITKMKAPGNVDGTYANLLQLSTNEGLISDEISSFLETEDGSIWIASGISSLTRYDGENAFTYDYPRTYKMTFDKQGRLWLASPQNSLFVLDFKNDIEYTIIPSKGGFLAIDILCDHTGTIYVASYQDGVYTMDPEMKSIEKLANKGSNLPFRLFEDSLNNLWYGFEDGIAVVDKERESLKTLSGNANYDLSTIITDIKEDRSGGIWLCLPSNSASPTNNASSSSLLRVSLKEQKVRVLTIETDYNIIGHKIEEDNQGNFWILGKDDVFVLGENMDTYKTMGLNCNMIGQYKVVHPLKRKDGSIWIATLNKGVVIANEFTLQTEYFDPSRGLIDEQIWEIEEDARGELWLGTKGGINIIDPKTSTIKALSHEKLHSKFKNTILFIKEISKDIYFIDAVSGFSIFERQKNKITQYASNTNTRFTLRGVAVINKHTFLLYTPNGLFLYDIESNILKKAVSKNDPDILKAVSQALLAYDKEILWVPSRNGLAKVNLKSNTVSYLREEQGLCDNNGTVAYISNEGELWLATLNGIAILNQEENTLTNLKEENGLLPTEIYDFIESGEIIYAASVNGLLPIEKASAKTTNKGFYNFNSGKGFKSNDYLEGSSKFLNNGQFWAGVSNTSNEYRLFILDKEPQPDSIGSSVFITSMFVMDEDPGFKEKSHTDSLKAKITTNTITESIKWDSLKQPYSLPKGLVLPYDQNSLSFSYASGDVFNRGQLSYRFILDGEDEDWNYTGSKTKTKNYYNLKPGQYSFKVAVRGFNKQWSTPDVLTFRINPPWWQTWWAFILFAIILASILRAYIVFRARKLTKENKLLEEKVKERTNALQASIEDLKTTQKQLIQSEKMASLGELTAGIAHEIQNPLNFVNNFSEVNKELLQEMEEEIVKGNYGEVKALAKDVADNEEKIIFHGKRADGIVKGMLQHSRSSSGQKESTDINALADEYLRLAYHGLRAKDKSFNATLNTDFDDTLGNINIVPQDIGRVVLNLITNAFYVVKEKKEQNPKGYEPTVTVSTKKKGNMVLVSVNDNGNGIPKEVLDKIFQPFFTTKPSGEGTGLGLSLSYDIVKVHGGQLNVETEQGLGTTFIISLPLN